MVLRIGGSKGSERCRRWPGQESAVDMAMLRTSVAADAYLLWAIRPTLWLCVLWVFGAARARAAGARRRLLMSAASRSLLRLPTR
eukprot:12043613-Alexandrium_andersonii.AAC.1